MNRNEWICAAILVAMCLTFHLASRAILPRLRPHFRPWVDSLIARLCPAMRMEPWLFEPIAEADLPPKQRVFFAAHTPPFAARHFTHLGDFVLRRDPQPSCVRLFLSPDRLSLGSLNCYLGEEVIEGMSVLLDGTYLETSTCFVGEPPPPEHGLRFLYVGTKDVLRVIDQHALGTAQAAAELGTTPLAIEPGEFQAVINYGRQLSLRSLHQQGMLEELPDFLRGKTRSE